MRSRPTTGLDDETQAVLGARISTHAPQRQGVTLNIVAGVLTSIVGALAIVWGIYTANETGLLCVSGGVVLIPLGAWGIWLTLRRRPHTVTVFRNGMTVARGGNVALILWEQVTAFYCDTPEHYASVRFSQRRQAEPSHFCKVKTSDGDAFVFDDTLRDVRGLADTIQQHTVTHIAPHVMTAFDAGAPVDFGPLVVSQDGIRAQAKFLPWPQVVRFDVAPRRGTVVIEEAENPLRWGTFMIAYIPNLTTLKVIVRRMLAEHTDGVALRTVAA